jgi:hypothetical protein
LTKDKWKLMRGIFTHSLTNTPLLFIELQNCAQQAATAIGVLRY